MNKYIIRSIQCKSQADFPKALELHKKGAASLYSTPVLAESKEAAQADFELAYRGQAVQFGIMTEEETRYFINLIKQSSKNNEDTGSSALVFGMPRKIVEKVCCADLTGEVEIEDIIVTVVQNALPGKTLESLNEFDSNHIHFGILTANELSNEMRLMAELVLQPA